MTDWRRSAIHPDASLEQGIAAIDSAGMQMAIVVDAAGRLLGTLSDGDVRRAILRGVGLSAPVSQCMNAKPRSLQSFKDTGEVLAIMRREMLHHIPLVDDDGVVVDLITLDALVGLSDRPNWVMLMVGGLGTRLRPLTDNCPKPMLPVNGKPILEGILERFIEQGFRKFYFSVNYLAEQIQSHFGDGSRHGVRIEYVYEHKRLGTAGALSLLPEPPDETLIVMNGDILTRVRFDQLLKFHVDHAAMATMAVREFDFQIPYGVVNLDGINIQQIDEKPVQKYFVNAGIYAISPETLSRVPKDTFYDMPTLFADLAGQGQSACAFPIRETWIDIGRLDEFERAQAEWSLGE